MVKENHMFRPGDPDERRDEAMESVYREGRHMQAYLRMQELYRKRMGSVRRREGAVHALDFGTGEDGVARGILDTYVEPGDTVSLYDPAAKIAPPRKHERVVGREEVFGPMPAGVNVVSIAFVLSLLEPHEARNTLRALREAHPDAEFIIVDYLLKGRLDLAELLVAKEEVKWRRSIGDAEFVRTRTRFDVGELCNMLGDSGMPVCESDVQPLDDKSMRGAVVVGRANEFFVAY